MSRRLLAVAVLVGGIAVAAWPLTSDAATDTPINILDNRYDPNDVAAQIDPRDGTARITWSNMGVNTHSVTSASGSWTDSGDLPGRQGTEKPSQFILDIKRPGTFNYFCRIHGANVMSGVLRVSEAGRPATTTTAAPATTTTIAQVTTTTAPPVTTTTTTPETATTTVEETTTTSSTSTTSTTEVALRDDDDDDDDESDGPLRIVGVGALLASAAATVVQARRFFAAG